MNLNQNQTFGLPIKQEKIIFGLLIVTSLILRLNKFTADPPLDLSLSQAIFTDPAQYVAYARNYVLFGSFNPLHDLRLIFFLKSTTTLAAVTVFKLLGVGFWQSNMVGLLFSFSTIILFYLAVRKIAGNVAALFYLAFVSLNYNQIFYGRLPFLENSMIFFAALSMVIMIYFKRPYVAVLAGLSLGVGVFFGKVIGLVVLFPFLCYAIYEYFYDYRGQFRKFIYRYGGFAVGFAVVAIAWYFISYRPVTASVEGYLQEQAFGLYGFPEAFESFDTFVYKYVSFGARSRLFRRMAVPGILTAFMMLIVFYRFTFKKGRENKLQGIHGGTIFLLAMIIGTFGALMIWNYRPLRYQTILIYPVCAAAGIFIQTLLDGRKTEVNRDLSPFYPPIFFIIMLIPIYQLMGPIYNYSGMPYHFTETRTVLLVVTVLTTIGMILWLKWAPYQLIHPPRWAKGLFIAVATLLAIMPNSVRYLNWNSMATFNTITNSRDIGTILSPEAVISGPYAADFTLENRFMNLIHMFGVASADSLFFERYPVTHLLLDKSNKKRAEEDYPQIMENAEVLAKYNVGGREVLLIRVVGLTGNIEADKYGLSPFEMAMYHFKVTKDKEAWHQFMQLHIRRFPENMTAFMAYAGIAVFNEAYDKAELLFRKACEFAPTDFRLRFELGKFYIGMYKITGDEKYKEKALAEFDLAQKYNYGSGKLKREIEKLLSPEGNQTGE